MGKKSKASYSGGTININGSNKVNTYKKKGSVVTDYNMSDAEKQAYDYAQKSFADNLSSINVFDDETKQKLQDQVDAYTLNGQKMIDNLYTPMLNSLKNDIASRFGNLDNSVFMDNLNSIEDKRADSMSSLAQDILAKQDEVVGNELARRYTYLSFLQDVQNQIDSNMLNLINASRQNSTSGNQTSSNGSLLGSLTNYANLAANISSIFV